MLAEKRWAVNTAVPLWNTVEHVSDVLCFSGCLLTPCSVTVYRDQAQCFFRHFAIMTFDCCSDFTNSFRFLKKGYRVSQYDLYALVLIQMFESICFLSEGLGEVGAGREHLCRNKPDEHPLH